MQNFQEPSRIVFYWTGQLPGSSLLSIVSALNKTTSSQVAVYLDQDPGFESRVPGELAWLEQHPRFRFVNFRLSEWVNDSGAQEPSVALSIFRRLTVAVLNKSIKLKTIGGKLPEWALRLIGFWHPIFGWRAKTKPIYAIGFEGPQFRGDVFRTLLARHFRNESVLYADLDVYFSRSLRDWNLSSSFTYRGGANWANTAILFYHQNRDTTIRVLGQNFGLGLSPLPWFMFTDENCSEAEIEIRNHELFDPGWSETSISRGDSGLFFRESLTSQQFLKEINENLLAVHWHNQWSVIPEQGSPFSVLLIREVKSVKSELEILGKLKDIP